ncbi:MAG: phosphatase PAP2 family protein [Ardenticatenaceae bacterium]|nr:phosphatase PAP2 family protein [Ardenticatenaceae bacterium]HBY93427.1 hypothetical protein [Chloroflexota bacterium]
MRASPASSKDRDQPARQRVEKRARFAWLRAMIQDEARRHRFLFVMSLSGLAIVAALAFLAAQFPTLPFDLDTTLDLQGIHFAPFQRLMLAISTIGYEPWAVIIVAAGSILVALLLGWKDGVFLGTTSGFQAVVNSLIKIAVGRPRPAAPLVQVFRHAAGRSFPSGHVMLYTVFFGFLFFLAWTRLPHSFWRALALILTGGLVLLVGPSRIYLGAHWLTDVVAGYILGFIILVLAIELYLKYLAPRRPTEQEGLVGERDRDAGSG